eukprot:403372559
MDNDSGNDSDGPRRPAFGKVMSKGKGNHKFIKYKSKNAPSLNKAQQKFKLKDAKKKQQNLKNIFGGTCDNEDLREEKSTKVFEEANKNEDCDQFEKELMSSKYSFKGKKGFGYQKFGGKRGPYQRKIKMNPEDIPEEFKSRRNLQNASDDEVDDMSEFQFKKPKYNNFKKKIVDNSESQQSSNNFDPERFLDAAYPELGQEDTQESNAYRKHQQRINWFKQQKIQKKRQQTQTQKSGGLFTSQIGDDYIVSDIRPSKRRKKAQNPDGDHQKDDLIIESFEGPTLKNQGQLPKEINFSQIQDGLEMPETITFTNTLTYGRIVGQPPKEKQDKDAPDLVKYKKGNGSVKGLHYRKYIALELLSEHTFACSFHKFFSHEMRLLIRSIRNTKFSPEMRVWVISVLNYEPLMQDLKRICLTNNIHIEDIPQFAINLMKVQIPFTLQNGRKSQYDYKKDPTVRLKLEEFLPPLIYRQLYSFQRDGIMKGIKFNGRILINDDFGTGKSLQALGLSIAYRNEWPLLILCPRFCQYMWRYEILKWLPGYDINRIQIIRNDKQEFTSQFQMVIIPYDIAATIPVRIENFGFKVCIADEVQLFKQRETKTNKILIELISKMKRVILLTGSNLTKKPQEIYSMMKMVRPDIMPGFYEFGYRYCDPRQSFDGIDFSNAGNMIELKQLLDKRIQTIFKRKYVFNELPDIVRQKLEVHCETSIIVKMQQLLLNYVVPREVQNPDLSFFEEMFLTYFQTPDKVQSKFLCDPIDDSKLSFQKSLVQIFRDLYDYSGQAKLKATYEVIDNILENGMRVLIFGYHLYFITAIEDHLTSKVKFLYLGKNVDTDYKQDICQKFNEDDSYKAVLIDLSEDLSDIQFLTPNTVILFAETFWNWDYMEKAESLIVTPGMKSANNVIYLFGRYTLDEYIFKLLYRQNNELYQQLEPLQLDLDDFRIKENLGQNYDELKSMQRSKFRHKQYRSLSPCKDFSKGWFNDA